MPFRLSAYTEKQGSRIVCWPERGGPEEVLSGSFAWRPIHTRVAPTDNRETHVHTNVKRQQQVPLEERLGVSSLWMPDNGETLWETIDLAYGLNFRSIEIVPADFQGNSGYPTTRFSVGLNLDRTLPSERDRLAKAVSRFTVCNVHSMHRGLNIASRNPGIRLESQRQYLQCAQLAIDIGARSVTFHPGHPETEEQIGDEKYLVKQNISFGKKVAEFAEKNDLLCGFENLRFPSLSQMQQILEGIGSQRFGLHLDVGHAWLTSERNPMTWLEHFGHNLVAIHMHGTYHRPDRGFENHQALELDDCTDFAGLMSTLTRLEFQGPIIFEILARDIQQYLELCRRGKAILMVKI